MSEGAQAFGPAIQHQLTNTERFKQSIDAVTGPVASELNVPQPASILCQGHGPDKM